MCSNYKRDGGAIKYVIYRYMQPIDSNKHLQFINYKMFKTLTYTPRAVD